MPEGADSMQIFQDEYENTYYYANNKIYYWKGAGHECLTEMPSHASVIGVMGGYAFYYVYHYNDPATKNPELFQIVCR